jgi:hypothetical protein
VSPSALAFVAWGGAVTGVLTGGGAGIVETLEILMEKILDKIVARSLWPRCFPTLRRRKRLVYESKP